MYGYRDSFKAQLKDAEHRLAQQSLEIEKLKVHNEEAKNVQERQSSENEKLKAALAKETVNVGKERKAKEEAMEERYVCVCVGRVHEYMEGGEIVDLYRCFRS